ncbi:hypothetical protein N7466_000495 [Penicillium verhagenii]|uniref:uncharacterized protein n=1 Tax=Penicillium verhagenii TaxID=1562060 RepID=UPI0025450E50|nr:uncharacterized protein N7466_000495 [Penicillium verhagenii]KAJ5947480.1 hypothetical protein N7466_000495 [Penicillium verhagenii]
MPDKLRGPHHEVYTNAARSLVDQFHATSHPRYLLIWLVHLPEALIDLLSVGDFTARLIFLAYAIAWKSFRDIWFVGNTGELLSGELIDPKEAIPPEWTDIVDSIREEFMK